jgi:UDP-N-acetylmuramoyl-tripeptide--D-alanyl-D-alanine ligase
MSAGLWTAFEAAAATGGALCARGGDPDRWIAEEWAADGLSIDSRTLNPGELFVALKDARDGHEFVGAAFERGASAALVARPPENAPDGAPLLVVGDTLQGLRDLAFAARIRNFGKRIAVTGSAGKTSTKEMLRAAFAAFGRVHASDKSYNNHWGVPLTLARMPIDADFGVFEIGMNHAGEITPLTRLVAPHVAIVTAIAPAHLEFFSGLDAIAEAKAEIFLGVAKGGAAVLPIDSGQFRLLRDRASRCGIERIITFGEGEDADIRLEAWRGDDDGAQVTASVYGETLEFSIGAAGRHQAMNALAVIGAARALGRSAGKAAAALKGVGAAAGRGAKLRLRLASGAVVTLVDESYNANPASMAAALAVLGGMQPGTGGRRIAVLGEMRELGPQGPALHAGLIEPIRAAKIDLLYLAGPLMEHLWRAAPAAMRAAKAANASALAPAVLGAVKDGDIVMVKGSNASRVSEIVSALTAAGRSD